MKKFRRGVLKPLGILSVCLVGCGSELPAATPQSTTEVLVAPISTSTRAAAGADWIDASDRFESEKADLAERATEVFEELDVHAANLPEANYLSEPVDIVAPGVYQLMFRDIRPEHLDLGYTVIAPPDTSFVYNILELLVDDDSIRITIEVAQENFRSEYLGFTAWIV